MGIVVNLTQNGNMTTVTVVTTWGRELATVTEASTIAAVIAAMRSTERRIAAKKEDIATAANVRKNKMAKWKYALKVLRAAQKALAERLVELAKAEALASGGKVWVNPWDGDVDPSGDVSVPQKWRDIRGGTSVRTWPCAQAGDIVTHEGTTWQVVVNEIHGGAGGYYAPVFSVYAIIPA